MPKLGQSIASLLKQYGLEEAVQLHRAVMLWEEAVGSTVAENCQALEIKGNTLYLRAKSAVWRNEIAFQKENILKALNDLIGSTMVKDIRFK
jgi:predicted nucleic acid-binding Zn ribbon protein